MDALPFQRRAARQREREHVGLRPLAPRGQTDAGSHPQGPAAASAGAGRRASGWPWAPSVGGERGGLGPQSPAHALPQSEGGTLVRAGLLVRRLQRYGCARARRQFRRGAGAEGPARKAAPARPGLTAPRLPASEVPASSPARRASHQSTWSLQQGQSPLLESHWSTQAVWNSWRHPSARRLSPLSKSERQMAHWPGAPSAPGPS